MSTRNPIELPPDGERGAALVLIVGVLALVSAAVALGFFAGRAYDDEGASAERLSTSPLARFEAAASREQEPTERSDEMHAASDRNAREQLLLARIPEADRPCTSTHESVPGGTSLTDAAVICSTTSGVTVHYELFELTVDVQTHYDWLLKAVDADQATLGECPADPGEQDISDGGVIVGRLACWDHAGASWLGWMSVPTGIIAVARGPEGMGPEELMSWWQGEERPLLTDEELAFFRRIPEAHRESCYFEWYDVRTEPTVAAQAMCGSAEIPDDGRFPLYYHHYRTLEGLRQAHEDANEEFSVSADSGSCPASPPGEGPLERSGVEVGRIGCIGNGGEDGDLSLIWWTTEPVLTFAWVASKGVWSLTELYAWWEESGGPVIEPGG